MRNREGELSRYDRQFIDDQSFTINPRLMQQLKLETCPETSPEGRALWLYLRLCQVLKYDEGYYYNEYRRHPNDDPYASFNLVDQVTAETPVTCFNFSRIAVKLLNRIPGVHALMIALGTNAGHFRFGYYTDRVSVDAEPSAADDHFNDMARVKLGIAPQGLKVFEGEPLMQRLMQRIVPPMLAKTRQSLQQYLKILQSITPAKNPPQIKIEYLVEALREQGVDGSSTVQLLFDMNRKFRQPPYQFARVALVDKSHNCNDVAPLLLVREGPEISQIDLQTLELAPLSFADYRLARQRGLLISPHDEIVGTMMREQNAAPEMDR